MEIQARIERALEASLAASCDGAPPGLAAALRHAVLPGGGRVRPRLCWAVAEACGDADPGLAGASAAAVELLHCASLAHDDLPCFDDAATRRGRPSLHQAFGTPLALLAGDALIVSAFETLARGAAHVPAALPALVRELGRAAGSPQGLAAGQAWESEPDISIEIYQRAKTASLFAFAAVAGAISAGEPAEPWRRLGERLGEAYQIADDLRDVSLPDVALGKPSGRDQALGRPNAALRHGAGCTLQRVQALARDAIESIPPCRHRVVLRWLIHAELERLLPAELVLRAAA